MRLWHFEFMRPNSCLPWLWGSCTILNVTQSGGFLWIGQHWQYFTSSRLPVPVRDSRPSFAPRVPAVRLEISMPREALMVLPMEAPVALPRDEDRTSSGDLQRHRQSKKHPRGEEKVVAPLLRGCQKEKQKAGLFPLLVALGRLKSFCLQAVSGRCDTYSFGRVPTRKSWVFLGSPFQGHPHLLFGGVCPARVVFPTAPVFLNPSAPASSGASKAWIMGLEITWPILGPNRANKKGGNGPI